MKAERYVEIIEGAIEAAELAEANGDSEMVIVLIGFARNVAERMAIELPMAELGHHLITAMEALDQQGVTEDSKR